MLTFMVYNLKGGVGKTTTSVNLAYLSSQAGFKTLLWDLDAQGACSFYLFDKKKSTSSNRSILKKKIIKEAVDTDYEHLDLLPSHVNFRNLACDTEEVEESAGKLEKVLSKMHDKYEVVFIDCPPTLSNLANTLFKATQFLIMPLVPSPLSFSVMESVQKFLQQRNLMHLQIFPFYNMVSLSRSLHKEALADRGPSFLDTFIRQSAEVEKMAVKHQPLPVYHTGEIANAYQDLFNEIFNKKDVKNLVKLIVKLRKSDKSSWVKKMVATSNLVL